jgi:UDP-N-acetylglucosamine 2-epimerase (hydrolysing)
MKHADIMVGNSSSGVREAPYFGTPSIDIGSRQHNRAFFPSIVRVQYKKAAIVAAIDKVTPLAAS